MLRFIPVVVLVFIAVMGTGCANSEMVDPHLPQNTTDYIVGEVLLDSTALGNLSSEENGSVSNGFKIVRSYTKSVRFSAKQDEDNASELVESFNIVQKPLAVLHATNIEEGFPSVTPENEQERDPNSLFKFWLFNGAYPKYNLTMEISDPFVKTGIDRKPDGNFEVSIRHGLDPSNTRLITTFFVASYTIINMVKPLIPLGDNQPSDEERQKKDSLTATFKQLISLNAQPAPRTGGSRSRSASSSSADSVSSDAGRSDIGMWNMVINVSQLSDRVWSNKTAGSSEDFQVGPRGSTYPLLQASAQGYKLFQFGRLLNEKGIPNNLNAQQREELMLEITMESMDWPQDRLFPLYSGVFKTLSTSVKYDIEFDNRNRMRVITWFAPTSSRDSSGQLTGNPSEIAQAFPDSALFITASLGARSVPRNR